MVILSSKSRVERAPALSSIHRPSPRIANLVTPFSATDGNASFLSYTHATTHFPLFMLPLFALNPPRFATSFPRPATFSTARPRVCREAASRDRQRGRVVPRDQTNAHSPRDHVYSLVALTLIVCTSRSTGDIIIIEEPRSNEEL